MAQNISLSTELSQNIDLLHRLLPLGKSFDLITRDLRLGETPAFWLGINGFCNTEILQQIFSDLQDPHYTLDPEIRDLPRYVQSRLGYAQISLTSSVDDILQNLLSGPSILLVDGFDQAVIIDVRTYPSPIPNGAPGVPGTASWRHFYSIQILSAAGCVLRN